MKRKLYNLALWYIGKCNAKWYSKDTRIKSLKRLTYHSSDKAYLICGHDAEWEKMAGYDVMDNAIQKLAEYEDKAELTENHAICFTA